MYINCKCKKDCPENNQDVLENVCNNVISCNPCKVDECECGFDEEECPFTNNPMFGHAYVPVQKINTTFTPCVGLKMGTIFPELVSPYSPNQSMEQIQFLKNSNEIKEGCNSGCV